MSTLRWGVRVRWIGFGVFYVLMCGGVIDAVSAGQLCMSKLGLHLEPRAAFEGPCLLSRSLACDDNALFTDSPFQVRGDPYRGYYVYIVATDIDTAFGFTGASLTLEYQGNVFINAWQFCTDTQTPQSGWPASGSGITLSFDSCKGKAADPSDPEGDATLLLGTFYIYAYEVARLAIGGIDPYQRRATVVSCDGDSTRLEYLTWYQGQNMVALGEIGLGYDSVIASCDQVGAVDNYCAAGWSDVMWRCCKPTGGCPGIRAQQSECACENAGGVWKLVKCDPYVGCPEAECTNTSAILSTWGKLKARY